MIHSRDFLLQGRKLIEDENKPTEVDFRSAISRAYYSLYHETLNFLMDTHRQKMIRTIISYFVDKKHSTNYDDSKVRSLDLKYLHEQGVNIHRTILQVLRSLNSDVANDFWAFKDLRNEADYEINKNLSRNIQQVRNELDEIENLIQSIKSFSRQ